MSSGILDKREDFLTPNEIMFSSLSLRAKQLYQWLLSFSEKAKKEKDKHFFIAPQEQLAQLMKCSTRTISRYLHELRHNQYGPLIYQVKTPGGRNIYKILPLPDTLTNLAPDAKHGLRIKAVSLITSSTLDSSTLYPGFASKKEVVQSGKELIQNTDLGAKIVNTLVLLNYDWSVDTMPPELGCSPEHRINIQAKNRRQVYEFAGKWGLPALDWLLTKKMERTSLQEASKAISKILHKDKLFKSERRKMARIREKQGLAA